MRSRINLSGYQWHLAGHTPKSWMMGRTMEQAIPSIPEIPAVPAAVPGSVHYALREAGILPDWNRKLNSFKCEWVDHRDWIYTVEIPRADLERAHVRRLRCLGLDGYGLVLFNGGKVGGFRNGYVPHEFDLGSVALQETNKLEIVFNDLPRFNGAPNISSEIREHKARFNYNWDWMPRNVQIGIWDEIFIELDPEMGLEELQIQAGFDPPTQTGSLFLRGALREPATCLRVVLAEVGEWVFPAQAVAAGVDLGNFPIHPWQCNGSGESILYPLRLELLDANGAVRAVREEKMGFKHVAWAPCTPSPAGADPWICELNGRNVFLVGVNWTPIRPHYADVTEEDYRLRLQAYKEIGFNILRVWGGAFLEKTVFYRLCDELGLMVWQEFPLSSSGPDNTPPSDPETIEAFGEVARSYVRRRRHHVSLLLWCGGNELQRAHDGTAGIGKPWDTSHPMLARFARICREEDPHTRYLPTSSSGPIFVAEEKHFGKGVHWDVHGPWRMPGLSREEAQQYWNRDDALFRSEAGAPGCSPLHILEEYYPGCKLLPVRPENPYKSDIFEGGHRVPFMVRWPGKVKAGAKNAETICLNDVMATCAEILGEKLPDNSAEDSVSLLPMLRGQSQPPRHEAIVHHSIDGYFAIRQGKWKLEFCPGSGGWSAPKPFSKEAEGLPPVQLYDLVADPGEKTNVQAENPEVVKQLTALMEKYIADGRSTPGEPQKNDFKIDYLKTAPPAARAKKEAPANSAPPAAPAKNEASDN